MENLEFNDIEQNTDEWLDMRIAKLTGSGFSKIMANYGKAFGEPAKDYATNIAIEIITGLRSEGGYTNDHMQRGHDQEPLALARYEEEMFCETLNGGFYSSDFIGVSPDFRTIDNGLGEIKSVIRSVHYKNVNRNSYDPAYKWQVIGNMHYTKSDYIDFVSYCADYPYEKQVFIYRLKPEMVKEEIKQLEDRVAQFKKLVKERIEVIKNAQYINLEGK